MPSTQRPWVRFFRLLPALLLPGAARGGVTFQVVFEAGVRAEPATGRLVVYLIREGAGVENGASPGDGPFFESPQPLFGVDVKDLAPGVIATLDDGAACFPCKPSELPPGKYRAQAVLDLHQDDSSWKREPGNLFSEIVSFNIDKDGGAPVPLPLTRVVGPPEAMPQGAELFQVRSELLSKFRGRDVMLRAGVVAPLERDPGRAYPAVYEVPGFGGNHSGAAMLSAAYRAAPKGSAIAALAHGAFWIVLDPEGPNGHHLFADSANNGPVGEALVKELIPALESKYNLVNKPAGRVLRGHSSGGWSSLWLVLKYPDTFSAAWSSSPDPVDFQKFQLGDIYTDLNMYVLIPPPPIGAETASDVPEVSSYREGGKSKMTVRQENRMEEVVGPNNISGQQWDSWQAVFGPRGKDGHPAELYDHRTGKIDRSIAEQYRKYDIAGLLRSDPARYGPIMLQRVRLLVGDNDSYYLNEAVALLKADVDRLGAARAEKGEGYIQILPGYDHGSIYGSAQVQAIPGEVAAFFTRAGVMAAGGDDPKVK